MAKKKINWREYNKELISRGSINLWFNPNDRGSWYAAHTGKNGRPFKYSIFAIEVLILIKVRFGLTLRAVQGFADSLFGLVGQSIDVPDYSTLCRRMKDLEINLDELSDDETIDTVIDSTGLKVYGEGEWKVKIHGRQKHRTWRKIHLAVNPKNNKILNAAVSTNDFKDNELFDDLLEGIESAKSIAADGAYDSNACYDTIEKLGAKALVPPRRGSKISKRGSQKPRDKVVREVKKKGRNRWKKESGYHMRSLAETAVWRFKSQIGDRLRSRSFENQATEALMACKVLNSMKTPKML